MILVKSVVSVLLVDGDITKTEKSRAQNSTIISRPLGSKVRKEMEAQQALLLKELADLLGFGDGAEDVLEHLLTIESGKVRTCTR